PTCAYTADRPGGTRGHQNSEPARTAPAVKATRSENVVTVQPRLRDVRIWLGVGAVVAVAAGLVWVSSSTDRDPGSLVAHPAGTAVGGTRLVSYPSCADMLADLRQHAARSVGMWGATPAGLGAPAAGSGGAAERGAVPAAAAPHSATNDYVSGADEPDL